MTISTKGPKSDSGCNAGAQGRDQGAKPVSGVFRSLYKWWKYGTIISVVLGIVLVGVVILGDVGEDVVEDNKLTALYKASSVYSQATEGINKLLNSKKSSFISNKAINFYLQEKVNKNGNHSELDSQFSDLEHFLDYFLTQRYQNQHAVKFPLSIYERNFIQVVDETVTSKVLRWLKNKVEAFLEKNELAQDKDVKELKWSRVKKLVDSAKFGQIIELVKDNVINWAWQWIGNPAKVTILLVDESTISESTPIILEKNKKLLKKWVQQNEDSTDIIILSRYSINHLYNQDKEDNFKSYQVPTGLDKFDKTAFCKYFSEQAKLNEAECTLMKDNFDSIDEVERFVSKNYQVEPSLLNLSQNQQQLERVLQKVCDKGHVKYYFYENQQNANKVLQRNKKGKKSRLDREMEALLVKFSQLKHFLGINRIKDVYSTLTAGSKGSEQTRLRLSEANSMGLLYDFETHQLRWKSQYERIGYEIRVERSCKGEKYVQEEMKQQEEKKERKDKEEKPQDEEQQQVVQDEQQMNEEVQEEYEESPVDYRHSGEEQEEGAEQQGQEQELVQQEQELVDSEEKQGQESVHEQGQEEEVLEQQEVVEQEEQEVTEEQGEQQEEGVQQETEENQEVEQEAEQQQEQEQAVEQEQQGEQTVADQQEEQQEQAEQQEVNEQEQQGNEQPETDEEEQAGQQLTEEDEENTEEQQQTQEEQQKTQQQEKTETQNSQEEEANEEQQQEQATEQQQIHQSNEETQTQQQQQHQDEQNQNQNQQTSTQTTQDEEEQQQQQQANQQQTEQQQITETDPQQQQEENLQNQSHQSQNNHQQAQNQHTQPEQQATKQEQQATNNNQQQTAKTESQGSTEAQQTQNPQQSQSTPSN